MPLSKLFKKIVCFGIIAAFILTRTGGVTYASSKNKPEFFPHLIGFKCSPKQLTFEGYIHHARADKRPAGVKIYRAKIKKNGKKGNLKKLQT